MRNHLFLTAVIFLTSLVSIHFVHGQNAKTKLQVTVIDNLGNNIEGATIIVYSSAEDYKNNENQLIKGKTDSKGRYQFKGLESKPYFLNVRKDHLKNDEQGAQTGLLSEKKINKVIVVIN